MFAPPLLFPAIFGDYVVSNFPCVNPSMDASTNDHSHNTPDSSPSFDSGEEKSFIENLLDISSTFFKNTEGKHPRFSSTLYTIHQTMRMLMNSLIFLIIAIMISLLLYSITMMIQSLLIFQNHLFMMIYLLMKSKPCRPLRHFSLSNGYVKTSLS